MQTGTANQVSNPNAVVWNSPGIWMTYSLVIGFVHIVLLSMPWLSTSVAWTLTNVLHGISMYAFLHAVKGTPFETADQAKYRYATHWEQIDSGTQFTATRKFFMTVPVVLYLLASFYSKYAFDHFVVNTLILLLSLIPKLPQFHGFRLFGINKY